MSSKIIKPKKFKIKKENKSVKKTAHHAPKKEVKEEIKPIEEPKEELTSQPVEGIEENTPVVETQENNPIPQPETTPLESQIAQPDESAAEKPSQIETTENEVSTEPAVQETQNNVVSEPITPPQPTENAAASAEQTDKSTEPATNIDNQTETTPENKTEGNKVADTAPSDSTIPPWRLDIDGVDKGNGWFNKKIAFIIIVVIVLMALGVAGYFYRGKISEMLNKTGLIKQPAPTPSASENIVKPTATPTEIPVDLSKNTIKVLNGSGIKGEAAKLQGKLEEDGFKVDSVGNATDGEYTDTIIRAKKDVDKNYIEKLKKSLETSYILGPVEELKDTESTDVVVVIGSKTAK